MRIDTCKELQNIYEQKRLKQVDVTVKYMKL